jgi:hypothetical protein
MYDFNPLDDVDRKKAWMRGRMAETTEALLKQNLSREELAQMCVELVLKWRFARGYISSMVTELEAGTLGAEEVLESMRVLVEVIGEPPPAWAGVLPEPEG